MRRYAARLLPLLVAGALVAGCGSAADDPVASASPTAPSPAGTPPSAAITPSSEVTVAPTPSMTIEPGGKGIPKSVLGTVSARKGSCLLFTPGDMATSWVLKGDVAGLEVGRGYTIEGAADDQLDPECAKYGPSFLVSRATPAS